MFVIPNEAAQLIRLQRTGLKGKSLKDIQVLYHRDCVADYISIIPALPAAASRVLDIGAGIGGVDVLVYRHYGGAVKLSLFDKDQVDKEIAYGFSTLPSAYNAANATKNFMVANGVMKKDFVITRVFPSKKIKYDLITSFISCGFHYPVEIYLSNILAGLADRGVAILDIRRNTGQMDLLHRHFNFVSTICVGKSHKRIICRHQL